MSEELKLKTIFYNKKIVPITKLQLNQKGNIAFIKGDSKVVQRLSDLGLTPMSEITVLRKNSKKDPIEISVRRTSLAIAHDIANKIFVKPMLTDRLNKKEVNRK